MCLSEGNTEILVKAGEYLDSSLHNKIVSCIVLIAKSSTYGRISPFLRVSPSRRNMESSTRSCRIVDVLLSYRKVPITEIRRTLGYVHTCKTSASLDLHTCVRNNAVPSINKNGYGQIRSY